ncbi:MAG: hypothetical protein M5U08_08300 [Burkholderiales bacterium]|nr:hypothetical protein [Burkholderiales bacterium]
MDSAKVTDPKAYRFSAGTLSLQPGEGQRRFEGLAYSGKEVTDHPFWPKVIFDLSSTRAPERVPVLLNHDGDQIVGHTEAVEVGAEIKVSGVLYADEPDGALVAKRSDAGFPWQMSVHIAPGRVDEVRSGETVKVNGQKFAGPGYVFRQARIREVSFTPVGADQRTHAVALSGLQQESNVEITQEQYDAVVAESKTLKEQVAKLTEQVSAFTAARGEGREGRAHRGGQEAVRRHRARVQRRGREALHGDDRRALRRGREGPARREAGRARLPVQRKGEGRARPRPELSPSSPR